MSNNLDFLNEFLDDKNDKYTKASFLKCDFDAPVWIIEYNDKKRSKIDFKITLSDNSLLTSLKNKKLLRSLKYWIMSNVFKNNSQLSSKSSMRSKIYKVLTVFDYFNMNDNKIDMCNNGFEAITNDFLNNMLQDLSSNNDKFEGGYKLSNRFYNNFIQNIHKDQNISIMDSNKNLDDLSQSEIQEYISYLNKNKTFKAKDLYPDTIIKPKTFPKELGEAKTTRTTTEYKSYFREKENKRLTSSELNSYIEAVKTLNDIVKIDKDLTFPDSHSFSELGAFIKGQLDVGRHDTYPSDFIFKAFNSAIDFHYKYGTEIVNTYTKFITELRKMKSSDSNFLYTNDVKNIFDKSLSKDLKKLGVKEFKSDRNKENKYKLLRDNYYYFDLLKVYYGAIQFIIGALMARRQSEMASLIAGECVDDINNVLLFKRSKSAKGLFGTRDTLALPLDPLGIEMIKNLEKIHKIIGGKHSLFSMPNFKNPTIIKETPDNTSYGENLDIFFDYIEAPVKNNKRLYLRQHQLRRFFAMSFFWSSGFGSMDTLRWFMGHTDVEHLYHYITESTPGAVLRSVKAQYVAEDISKHENLYELIKTKYNVDHYDIIETEDLVYYIEELIEDGEVEIEPSFLEDDNGMKYKILVTINEKGI